MAVHIIPSGNAGTLRIHVDGAFNFHVHRQFREAYRRNGEGVSQYVIDLSGTEYMDSSALGMLVLLHEHLAPGGSRVRIVNADPGIQRTLRTANLDRLMEIG